VCVVCVCVCVLIALLSIRHNHAFTIFSKVNTDCFGHRYRSHQYVILMLR